MANLDRETIRAFLETVGQRCARPAQVSLLGGGALCLLGHPRPTLDIDYVGDDLHKDDLQQVM